MPQNIRPISGVTQKKTRITITTAHKLNFGRKEFVCKSSLYKCVLCSAGLRIPEDGYQQVFRLSVQRRKLQHYAVSTLQVCWVVGDRWVV